MSDPRVIVVDEQRIDYETSAAFQERLLEAIGDGSGEVILDFGAVQYISSVGLRALVVASKKCKTGGGKILVAALQPLVHEVFQISRFDILFHIYATVEQALAALNAEAAS